MKTILPIFICFLFFGCHSTKNELQTTWVCKYSILNTDKFINNYNPTIIFDFTSDSVLTKHFYFDFIGDNYNDKINVYGYSLKSDSLFFDRKGKIDTAFYSCSNNRLTLDLNQEYSSEKIVLEQLKNYDLAKERNNLYEFLISSSFEIIQDSINIEFKEDNKFIASDFGDLFRDNQSWIIDSYKEELFLIIDGFRGFVLQIKTINQNGFTGIIYGKENREIEFKKIDITNSFNLNDLIGEWEEVKYIDKNIPPPPLPFIDTEKKFFKKEFLIITNSVIYRHYLYQVDTINWETQ